MVKKMRTRTMCNLYGTSIGCANASCPFIHLDLARPPQARQPAPAPHARRPAPQARRPAPPPSLVTREHSAERCETALAALVRVTKCFISGGFGVFAAYERSVALTTRLHHLSGVRGADRALEMSRQLADDIADAHEALVGEAEANLPEFAHSAGCGANRTTI